MANILHIDTAGSDAYAMLSKDAQILASIENNVASTHASFLHPAIEDVLTKTGVSLNEIDAVSVANGPGSYTGLRVGLAAAKGICYALNKPLICLNGLKILATAVMEHEKMDGFYVPMIDARRLEVFTAVYDKEGKEIIAPQAKILEESSFSEQLAQQKIFFFGDGAEKWKKICQHPNARFLNSPNTATAFASLSYEAFTKHNFANLAYVEPFYLKDFHFGN